MLQQVKQKIGEFNCVVVRDNECEQPKAVVILCHGFGAPGTDLVPIGDELASQPDLSECVFVFPPAPIEMDPLFDARAWWPIDIEKIQQLMMEGEARQLRKESPELLPERRKSLSNLIDLCRVDFKVEPGQVIIGGFSQGSMLATDVALHYGQPLGGVIVWSGSLINESIWKAAATEQAKLKFIMSHGRLDPVLPMKGAEDLRDMLMGAGHSVRFHEFNGQHAIPMEAIELGIQLIKEAASAVPG